MTEVLVFFFFLHFVRSVAKQVLTSIGFLLHCNLNRSYDGHSKLDICLAPAWWCCDFDAVGVVMLAFCQERRCAYASMAVAAVLRLLICDL